MPAPSSVTPTYGAPAIEMARGDGVYLFDVEGKRYLDFAAVIADTALGHGHTCI